MKAFLNNINRVKGVLGSMLVGKDGMIVATEVSDDVDQELVSAVASSIVSTLDKVMVKLELGRFSSFVISGIKGKVALMDTGVSFLVVMLEKEANVGLILVELKDSAKQIQESLKL